MICKNCGVSIGIISTDSYWFWSHKFSDEVHGIIRNVMCRKPQIHSTIAEPSEVE